MSSAEKDTQEKTPKSFGGRILNMFTEKMAAHCPCGETMAKMAEEHGEGSFCETMMASCCGTQEETEENAQEA